MSLILIITAALAGLWLTGCVLAICLCKVAQRGDELRAASMAASERAAASGEPRLRQASRERPSRVAA
jgi:hypothetical protein